MWGMHSAIRGFQSGYPRNIQLGHMVRFLMFPIGHLLILNLEACMTIFDAGVSLIFMHDFTLFVIDILFIHIHVIVLISIF